MAWQEQQTHKQPEYKTLSVDKPGFGGVNIKDLDFMLKPQESPKMKNMMVKDGVFKKRYGQKKVVDLASKWNPYSWNRDKKPAGYEWNHIVMDDDDNIYVIHDYPFPPWPSFNLTPYPIAIQYGVEPPDEVRVGDPLDLSAVTVLAVYSDGTTVDVTSQSTLTPAHGTIVDQTDPFPEVAVWVFHFEV